MTPEQIIILIALAISIINLVRNLLNGKSRHQNDIWKQPMMNDNDNEEFEDPHDWGYWEEAEEVWAEQNDSTKQPLV